MARHLFRSVLTECLKVLGSWLKANQGVSQAALPLQGVLWSPPRIL